MNRERFFHYKPTGDISSLEEWIMFPPKVGFQTGNLEDDIHEGHLVEVVWSGGEDGEWEELS